MRRLRMVSADVGSVVVGEFLMEGLEKTLMFGVD